MSTLHLEAPAKVNLRLDVLNKRPDGYHDLRMVMQRIDLCDDISITLGGSDGIRVTCGTKGVPDGAGNIAWRAANALVKLTERPVGVDISITKRIPIAAGLGGGSSNAATVLVGLNRLLGLNLDCAELMRIGVTLGADVPFFIFERPALAEGIGERLTPLQAIPQMWLVVVNPGIHVSTAWAYQNLRLTSGRAVPTIPVFFKTVSDVCSILSNDLEQVTIEHFPVIAEIKRRLTDAGAVGSLMSGSGPTVFGLFGSKAEAVRASGEIDAGAGWFVTVAATK